jgi:prepilin-type N-terminal cleavage/methylation domain-containing protein
MRKEDMQLSTRAQRDQNGFTLIELLIVIAVLGILSGIAIFAVGSTKKDAASTACKTDFKSIALSAEAVNTKIATYPTTNADLLKSGGKGGVLDEYPTSTEYKLVYAPPVAPSTLFTITVQKPNGTAVATNPTSASGCDAL